MTDVSGLPTAGWYPDPRGGSGLMWWDGTAWNEQFTHAATPEGSAGGSAPEVEAVVVAPAQPSVAIAGVVTPAVVVPGVVVPTSQKTVVVAVLFGIFLSGIALHFFYLRKPVQGVFFLLLYWGGVGLTTVGVIFWLLLIVGIPMLIAAGIWWIVSMCLISKWVREANAPVPARA